MPERARIKRIGITNTMDLLPKFHAMFYARWHFKQRAEAPQKTDPKEIQTATLPDTDFVIWKAFTARRQTTSQPLTALMLVER